MVRPALGLERGRVAEQPGPSLQAIARRLEAAVSRLEESGRPVSPSADP
jgi:hypothetical protein